MVTTEVAERAVRNRLTLGYACGDLVGNATMRPPSEPEAFATVIVRVLHERRRGGRGTACLLDEHTVPFVDLYLPG